MTGDLETHNDRDKRILELLVCHLGVHVDTREPASVSRVRMVPSHGVLEPLHSFAGLDVLDHVLVRLVLRIDTRLGTLHGQCEGVDNDERCADHFALHKPHDLVWHARPSMDDLIV